MVQVDLLGFSCIEFFISLSKDDDFSFAGIEGNFICLQPITKTFQVLINLDLDFFDTETCCK